MPRNCVFLAAAFVWTGPEQRFARLGSALLVALLGDYATMTLAIAGVLDYISVLAALDRSLDHVTSR